MLLSWPAGPVIPNLRIEDFSLMLRALPWPMSVPLFITIFLIFWPQRYSIQANAMKYIKCSPLLFQLGLSDVVTVAKIPGPMSEIEGRLVRIRILSGFVTTYYNAWCITPWDSYAIFFGRRWGYTSKFLECILMHKKLSLGYTRAETEDCKKKLFFLAAKNGGYTPGGLYSYIRHYSMTTC